MTTTFAIHVDCDPLWVYEREYQLDAGHHDLIYQQALPAFLELCQDAGVKASFFMIGQELLREDCRSFCRKAVESGNAIANHSFTHRIDFGGLGDDELRQEIVEANLLIQREAGFSPKGFRAPGYCHMPAIAATLSELNYLYDSSVLPGPAALMMQTFFWLKGQAKDKSFDAWRNFFASRRLQALEKTGLMSVPIAVMPFLRMPIHTTFVYQFGVTYLKLALEALSRSPGHHVLLFHAIDLLDHPQPERFSGQVLPLRHSFSTRCDIVEYILRRVSSRVVLTENFLDGGGASSERG